MKPCSASTIVLCFGLALSACSTKHYRASADRETARIIADKTPAVRNMDPHFTIEQTNVVSLDGYPVTTNAPEFFGAEGQIELGARVLSLEDALDQAVKFNRAYQTRKEQVYLTALNLTLARNQFTLLVPA